MTRLERINKTALDLGIDPKSLLQIIERNSVEFAAEYIYYKANPETHKDVPSIMYEAAENNFKKWIAK